MRARTARWGARRCCQSHDYGKGMRSPDVGPSRSRLSMSATIHIYFPSQWISGPALERALRLAMTEESDRMRVVYHFPLGCKVVVDAGARLLSLIHQHVEDGWQVTLDFEDPDEALGYLNRAGFIRLLPPNVHVLPERPNDTQVLVFEGTNDRLVEFKGISPHDPDAARDIPQMLTEKVDVATAGRPDAKQLSGATYTILSELIGNIYEHSETRIDGFVALQVYRNAHKACVVVSDSGKGLLTTIRPALGLYAPDLINLSDAEVVDGLLTRGLSRHGSPRGAGLHSCAKYARTCGATIDLRLATCALTVSPNGIVSQT